MCVRGVDISVVVEVTRRVMRVYISAENLRRRETPRPARHRRVLGRYTNRGRRTGADRYYWIIIIIQKCHLGFRLFSGRDDKDPTKG